MTQVVRASPPAHRVLDARRRGAGAGRRRHGRRRRPARGRHHRPREHVRRPRLLPRRARRELTPVLGMEAYFVTTSRFDRPRRDEHEIYHLTLLAESTEGYKNLIKVVVGRVPRRLLLQAARRLRAARAAPRRVWSPRPAVSAARCASGSSPTTTQARANSSRASSTSSAATSSSSSCRTTGSPSSTASTRSCCASRARPRARRCSPPTTVTTRTVDDAESHAALLCVQTGSTLDDPKRFKFDADEFYLKTAAEMRHLFRDYEEACDNTLLDRRARRRRDRVRQRGRCRRSRRRRPRRRLVPARAHVRGREGALRIDAVGRRRRAHRVTSSASSRRWGSRPTSSWSGTSCRYARTRGIRVGPGRGSAAGSCVAYCLRIVDIDPIKYDLLFERFLNPGRKQMPDIDMDFDSRYRGEMIRYAAQRYGADHVAQIVTFSTIKARAAVRDCGARPRLPLRRRRQDRQADAAAHHGPRHAARVPASKRSRATTTATRWPPTCARSTTPIPTPSASSTSRAASKACAARTASMRLRS